MHLSDWITFEQYCLASFCKDSTRLEATESQTTWRFQCFCSKWQRQPQWRVARVACLFAAHYAAWRNCQ